MTEAEALTLQMLKKMDEKLERLLRKMSGETSSVLQAGDSPFACARKIAALTPRAVRQTDAVELLHEDRLR